MAETTVLETPPPPKAAGKPVKEKEKVSLIDTVSEGKEGYKKLWPFVRKYKGRFIASIVAGGGSAILTAAQIQVLRVVTHHVFHESGTGQTVANTSLGHAAFICSLLPLAIVARCVCDYLETYYMTWVSLRVLHDLRMKIFSHILGQSLDFFNQSKIGSLISRVSNDTRSAQLAISAVTDDIVTQPLTVIGVIGGMLWKDWHFTTYSLCLFPLCLVPIMIYGKKVRKIGRLDEAANAELMVILHEALSGVRLVKSLCREPYEEKRFASSSHTMVSVSLKVRKAMASVGPMIEGMGAFGVAMAFMYVFFSHMLFSNFVFLIGSLFCLYGPVKKLSKVHVNLQKALGATTKIFELLDIEPTIQDAPEAVALKRCRGEIEFDDVSFTYNPKRPAAVRHISLKIPPGKTYALVGASGAGKSTMFSLLLRFYEAGRGAIKIDGRDIRTITQKSLRQQIGIVSQDTFLFNETILENIRYGRLDATDEEVYEAARQAYAHDFILAQADGYLTTIGDKGCMISGGQQQRLAIARALLKNAPILLLDEATSALDSESEKEIQAALARLAVGRTVIAIAHRLSTILAADQIVVMHQSEIKEVGRHEELLKKSGLYRRLYDLQFNSNAGLPHAPVFEVLPVGAS